MLLLAIILAVAIALLVIWAEYLLDEGAMVVTPRGSYPASESRKKRFILSEDGKWRAIVLGLGVGAISYLTPKLPVFFSFIFFLLMLYAMFYLAKWWKRDGSRFREVIPFILLSILFSIVLGQTVAMLSSALSGTFWGWLLTLISTLAGIILFWYLILSTIFYQADELEDSKDKEERAKGRTRRNIGHILLVIALILAILALMPSFRSVSTNFGIDASRLGWNTSWFQPGNRQGQTQPTPTQTPAATAQPSTWYRFYNTDLLNDNDPNNNFNFGPNPYNKNETAAYYDRSYRSRMRIDPALAAADMAWHDAIVGTRYLGTFYEECKGNWATTINTAKVKFMGDQALFNQTLDSYFAFLDTADSVELRYVDSGLEDQMYMNGYTVDGVPDVIVMKTTDHDGWFLVYTFVIKGQKFEVAYRIDCGYQPTNVEEVMDIPPVNPPTPPQPTPPPTDPPSPPPTDPPSPPPTDPPSPPPTDPPSPPPTDPPKDPTQGTDVGGNDDPGPGTPTSTGPGGQTSTEDQPTNSDHMTHEEYVETIQELEDINEHQQTGDQPSTPTTTTPPSTHVDDQGDTGSGHGGANDPTPVQPPVHVESPTGEQTQLSPEQPGEAWGGPPD